MPEYWTHKWQGSELMINFGDNKIFLNMVEQNQRQAKLEQKVLQMTKNHHDKWLTEARKIDFISDIYDDPFKIQQWHHGFDPHSAEIPEVETAQLSTPP